MFCSHCGAEAANKFCSNCGQPLGLKLRVDAPHAQVADWHHEVRYEVLLNFPEVRERIASAAAQAKKAMTGEQWLELFDKAYVPLVGVSLSTVASICSPIYAKMGIQTGKQRSQLLAIPSGTVIVNSLCSLARNNRALKTVHPASDGCVIEATLPSDIWSFAGDLLITVHQQPGATQVDAATKIPGQLYDWGKSSKCLDQLFGDLSAA